MTNSLPVQGLEQQDEGRERGLSVVLYEPLSQGGICHYTYNLAESLARAGCRVTLLTGDDYELAHLPRRFRLVSIFRPSWIRTILSAFTGRHGTHASREGARQPEAGSGSDAKPQVGKRAGRLQQLRLRLLFLRAIGRILAARSRILHVQWSAHRKEELRFLRLLKRLGVRTVYTAHDLLPNVPARPGDRESLTRLYQAFDQVVVFAEGNRRELIDSFGVAADRVSVIPHGSGNDLFPTSSQESARAALHVEESKRVILFFGYIKRYKGLEYLVEAFDRVREEMDDALLLVAGAVSKHASEFDEYSSLVETLRTRNDVVCDSEYIPSSRVGLYFAAADVVVLPYVKTYHSGILMMAYAAGRPVVVTSTGMLAEDVREGSTGFVVPPKDSRALADRILEILALPDRGRAMGEAGRQLAETSHSWSAAAAQSVTLYRRLLKPVSTVSGRAAGGHGGATVAPPDGKAGSSGVRRGA
jgi:glycosyltransferase involved in cell wall biosynthesis